MNAKQATIDKSSWGSGPWHDEPDRVEWEHAGLPCLMVRHSGSGHWCGYAAIPPSHSLHGKHYDAEGVDVDVHGGLTYADKCTGDICHVPKPGEPDDVWWFGFDCAHAGDHSPAYDRYNRKKYVHAEAMKAVDDWQVEKYRAVDYVQAETNRLAEQLLALGKG